MRKSGPRGRPRRSLKLIVDRGQTQLSVRDEVGGIAAIPTVAAVNPDPIRMVGSRLRHRPQPLHATAVSTGPRSVQRRIGGRIGRSIVVPPRYQMGPTSSLRVVKGTTYEPFATQYREGYRAENGRYPNDRLYGDGRAGGRIADLLERVPLSIEKRLAY